MQVTIISDSLSEPHHSTNHIYWDAHAVYSRTITLYTRLYKCPIGISARSRTHSKRQRNPTWAIRDRSALSSTNPTLTHPSDYATLATAHKLDISHTNQHTHSSYTGSQTLRQQTSNAHSSTERAPREPTLTTALERHTGRACPSLGYRNTSKTCCSPCSTLLHKVHFFLFDPDVHPITDFKVKKLSNFKKNFNSFLQIR